MKTAVTRDPALAAEAIAAGKLAAFATETVYGLGANALDDRAVASVYEAKGRPRFNPLIVHVASAKAAFRLGEFNGAAKTLAQVFWPGPLTLVVPRAANCPVSMLASAGLPSIAIRVPGHDGARHMLDLAGVPVVAPSANRSGAISPTRPNHVLASLDGRIDVLLDGGPCDVGVESTIVSCLEAQPVLLRAGGLAADDIAAVTSMSLLAAVHACDRPVAPGQLESHYAPRAALRMGVKAPAPGEAFLTFGVTTVQGDLVRHLSRTGNLREAAANLFAMLHELDATGVERIAVMPVPETGLGAAINDRLSRAAAPRP